jgi:hypothetical protein
MTVRSSSAQRKKRDDGVRWHVFRADLKNFFGHFAEHGMLTFDEDPRKPLWREP